VGGLITLACTSAAYVFYTAPARLNAMIQRDLKQAEDLGVLIRQGKQYVMEVNAVGNRSLKRFEALEPLAKNLRRYEELTPALVDQLGKMATASRLEAEYDRGVLAAYASEPNYSPEQTHRVQQRGIADELAMWESLDNLVEAVKRKGGKSDEAERAFAAWKKQILDVSSDEAAISQDRRNVLDKLPDLQRQANATEAKAFADIAAAKRRRNFALAGFVMCDIALVVIAFFAFDLKTAFR
jgi:hypothetical protein